MVKWQSSLHLCFRTTCRSAVKLALALQPEVSSPCGPVPSVDRLAGFKVPQKVPTQPLSTVYLRHVLHIDCLL